MPRTCQVCGRTIITGRKYCHIHRNSGKENSNKGGDFGAMLILGIILVGVLGFIVYSLLNSVYNFALNNWIFIVIICLIPLAIEGYRIKQLSIKGISKTDDWIIAIFLTIIIMILLSKFYKG